MIWYDLNTWSTNIIQVTAYSLVKGATCVNYATFYSKEEKICLGQIIFKVGAKSLYTRFSYVMFIWSTSQIRPCGKCTYSEKRIFALSDLTLILYLQALFKVISYPYINEVCGTLDQGFYIKFSIDLNLRPSIIV